MTEEHTTLLTYTDTITAIATAPGRGGVGIIRISGPLARQVGESIIQHTLTPRYAHYGNFIDPEKQTIIDQGIALYFPNPHSFTGEDVVELQGHGGPVVLDQLLTIITRYKVRLAKTIRSFLNGRFSMIKWILLRQKQSPLTSLMQAPNKLCATR